MLGAGSCAWPPTPQFRPRSVADIMGDGAVRRTELLGALGAWYLSTKRQPTPAMQVRAGRGVGDKAASSCPRMEGTLSFHTERLQDIFTESVGQQVTVWNLCCPLRLFRDFQAKTIPGSGA